jgi:phenylalanyl-tRNA synthetase beta chain
VGSLRAILGARDYQEIISYSFIDEAWEQDLCNNPTPVRIKNPIANHMNVMRSSLVGGLLDCLRYNLQHKQSRVRLFELGRCFVSSNENFLQPQRLGGLCCGNKFAEQWGAPSSVVDFFDVKADVEALFPLLVPRFTAAPHPALHPGQSAEIQVDGEAVGWLGALHPRWQQKYEFPESPILFELDLDALRSRELPIYREISKYPVVSRDIAVVVDESLTAQALLEAMYRDRPAIVSTLDLFDVYRGEGIAPGKKSLAFRVLMQDTQRTLTDQEADAAVAQLTDLLISRFGAIPRTVERNP